MSIVRDQRKVASIGKVGYEKTRPLSHVVAKDQRTRNRLRSAESRTAGAAINQCKCSEQPIPPLHFVRLNPLLSHPFVPPRLAKIRVN